YGLARKAVKPEAASSLVSQPRSEAECRLDCLHGGVHGVLAAREALGGFRVFETVAGEDANAGGAGDATFGAGDLEKAGDRGGGGRLTEDAFFSRHARVGIEDLVVCNAIDGAAGFVARCNGAFPARRVADSDGGGDRLWICNRVPENDRSGARGLKA